jgi:DNA polymerase III delta prime subunit
LKRYLSKSIALLFSARAGCGKTTSALYLNDKLSIEFNCIVANFAGSLKSLARDGFGWDGLKDQRGRKLLQEVGQIGRNYNPNLWVARTLARIENYPGYPFEFVLVDDWRFPNEVDYIRKNPLYSVYTVRIIAPNLEVLKGTPEYNDVSEVSLTDEMGYDFVVDNTSSFENLYIQLDGIVKSVINENIYYTEE